MNSLLTHTPGPEISPGSEAIKRSLIDEIGKAISVIGEIDDLSYCRDSRHSSSVGEQFRHNLDFLNTFLSGLDIGKIDYARRERDPRVSVSRGYAIERFESVARRILMLSRTRVSELVSVRSEVAGSVWLASSVVREMEFVLSHTVHHHALIAEKLEGQGIMTDRALGVAPSTREYWSRLAA
jgi:hypothetical protein